MLRMFQMYEEIIEALQHAARDHSVVTVFTGNTRTRLPFQWKHTHCVTGRCTCLFGCFARRRGFLLQRQ